MRLLGILLALIIGFAAHAQKENNTWCMGHSGGIDFNTTPPSPFTSQINAIETAASISDRNTGALLFYTDGTSVWDATHNIMQNGDTIGTDFLQQTTPQGTVIIPFLNDAYKYYIFNIGIFGKAYNSLFYSVVDMRLNNGLGAVVQGQKKVLVDTGFSEAILAIPGCGNVWLLTQQYKTGEFWVYGVTEQGIDPNPVISKLEHLERPSDMAMYRVSHDNKTIMSCGVIFAQARPAYTEYMSIQDFDVMTGKVSNNKIIDKGGDRVYYDFEFSPNSRFVYACSFSGIYQYDLADRSVSAIRASRKNVSGDVPILTGMQLRPDGNIYIAGYERDSLSMISNCDAAFPNCVFTYNALKIGGEATYKLPAQIAYPLTPVSLSLGDDTTICSGGAIELSGNAQPAGTSYQWSTGDTTPAITVDEEGVYILHIDNKGCKATDDVAVQVHPKIEIDLGADATICKGDKILLPLSSTTVATDKYLWQDGSVERTYTVSKAGVYRLTVANVCDTVRDTLVVTDRNCHFFFPSAFSPNGDGRNDLAHLVGDVSVVTDYSLHIVNRWGEAVYHTKDATQGWDGTYKGQKTEVGTYFYIIKYTYDGEEELLKGDITLIR